MNMITSVVVVVVDTAKLANSWNTSLEKS